MSLCFQKEKFPLTSQRSINAACKRAQQAAKSRRRTCPGRTTLISPSLVATKWLTGITAHAGRATCTHGSPSILKFQCRLVMDPNGADPKSMHFTTTRSHFSEWHQTLPCLSSLNHVIPGPNAQPKVSSFTVNKDLGV